MITKRANTSDINAKHFFMFMMFMWVASVTDLTSFNFGRNPYLMPVYLLILGYYFVTYCKKSIKPLLIFCAIIGTWFILSCIKYGSLQGFQFQPIYSIIIAHIAFNLYDKDEFLYLFEKILVWLCSLSLIVWLCTNIIGDPFNSFMHTIAVVENRPPTDAHCFITGIGSSFELGLRRNIGFTWEPGKFSCWVLIGLFFNLVRYKFNFRNRHFYVLLATLFTTLSTTGYATFGIIILFILLNKKSKAAKFIIIASVALLLPTILGLSFMSEKIVSLTDIEAGASSIEYHNQHDGMDVVCPQRFTGAYMSFMNLINDVWLGFNQLTNSYATRIIFNGSVVVAPSEGIIGVMAKYGIFVGSFFYYWLIKSSKYLSESLGYKGSWMFFFFFLAISFSYDWWENCIMMYFYLGTFYRKFDNRYFEPQFGNNESLSIIKEI